MRSVPSALEALQQCLYLAIKQRETSEVQREATRLLCYDRWVRTLHTDKSYWKINPHQLVIAYWHDSAVMKTSKFLRKRIPHLEVRAHMGVGTKPVKPWGQNWHHLIWRSPSDPLCIIPHSGSQPKKPISGAICGSDASINKETWSELRSDDNRTIISTQPNQDKHATNPKNPMLKKVKAFRCGLRNTRDKTWKW